MKPESWPESWGWFEAAGGHLAVTEDRYVGAQWQCAWGLGWSTLLWRMLCRERRNHSTLPFNIPAVFPICFRISMKPVVYKIIVFERISYFKQSPHSCYESRFLPPVTPWFSALSHTYWLSVKSPAAPALTSKVPNLTEAGCRELWAVCSWWSLFPDAEILFGPMSYEQRWEGCCMGPRLQTRAVSGFWNALISF